MNAMLRRMAGPWVAWIAWKDWAIGGQDEREMRRLLAKIR